MTETEITEAIESHCARNEELRKLMVSRGVDAGSPQRLDVFFYAEAEEDAERLAGTLRSENFTSVTVSAPEEMVDAWAIQAGLSISIDDMVNPLFTDQLVRMAAAHSAEYDGWGTAL